MDNPASGAAAPAPALSRELNLFHLTMMGVGMMIGAGAVIGMGISVGLAGPGGTLVAFALDGLVALFTAMAYAEMSSAVPKAGSIYNFARIAVGRATGFSAGWIAWFASAVAGSFYAVILAEYTVELFARLGLLAWLPADTYWVVRFVAVVCAGCSPSSTTGASPPPAWPPASSPSGRPRPWSSSACFGLVIFILDPSRIANFKPFLPGGGAVSSSAWGSSTSPSKATR